MIKLGRFLCDYNGENTSNQYCESKKNAFERLTVD